MRCFKKLISLLLLLGLLCTTFPLASCAGGDSDKDTATTQAPGQSQSTTDEDNGRMAIPDNLPDKDYGGAEFRVLTRTNPMFTCRHIEEIIAEKETGEVINDAVYTRNKIVEDRFNVKIVNVSPDSGSDENGTTNYIKKSVLAGDNAFDLISHHMVYLGVTAPEGFYYNWYDIPHIDLEKPWWLKSATEELTIEGKTFFSLSHLGYNALDYTYCYYFNKNMAMDYGIENLYQTVREGKWTIDYLNSIIKDIYKDLDSDGKRNDTDLYGLVTNTFSATVTYLWSFDNPVTKKGGDGLPELVLNTPKMASLVTKLYELFYDTTGVYATNVQKNTYGEWWDYAYNAFKNGNALFATGMFNDSIINYRDVEFDYGMLPYPKWDESQENYYTMMDGHGPLLAVPTTITDPEFVGIITEAMSAEGYKLITPAYYDVALKTKYARDDETVEMLDIILDGRRFDFGYIYDGWNGMAFSLQTLLTAKNSDFTSFYEKNEKKVIAYYDKIIKAYQDYTT